MEDILVPVGIVRWKVINAIYGQPTVMGSYRLYQTFYWVLLTMSKQVQKELCLLSR